MNYSEYFITIQILSTIFSFIFINSLTTHGRTEKKLTKNVFTLFYAYAIALLHVKTYTHRQVNIYILHLIRRLIETLIFRYRHGKMSILQLFVAFLYYTFIVENIYKSRAMNKHLIAIFIFFNILQSICHYVIWKWYVLRYSHYVCEFLIYFTVFCNESNLFFGLNCLWIIVYGTVTYLNRNRKEKSNL